MPPLHSPGPDSTAYELWDPIIAQNKIHLFCAGVGEVGNSQSQNFHEINNML